MTEQAMPVTEPTVDADGNIHMPARVVPVPASVSAEAAAFLRTPRAPQVDLADLASDPAAWQAFIDTSNAVMEPRIEQMMAALEGRATVETTEMAGVTVHVARPTSVPEERRDWVRMTVHGGAFVLLGGRFAAAEAGLAAAQSQCLAIGVDYRMPPEHPFPAAVDDVIAVYEAVLAENPAARVAISGGSAGANIAPGAVLKARDNGLPMPRCLLLSTPHADLTESGDSFVVNNGLDHMLRDVTAPSRMYAGDEDLRNPYLSPVFGDFDKGFPPTMIATGTRDLLLSPSVMLHRALRRAGIDADLHVWDAAPHGNFPVAPERTEQAVEEELFIAKHLA